MRPTIGRIVRYVVDNAPGRDALFSFGVPEGTRLPAIVIGVQEESVTRLSLKVFTFSKHDRVVEGATEGTEPGQWHWPPREP